MSFYFIFHFWKAFYTGFDFQNILESVEKNLTEQFVFTIETFWESKSRLKKYMQNILLSKHNLKTKHQTTQICRMKTAFNITEVVFIKGVKVTYSLGTVHLFKQKRQ